MTTAQIRKRPVGLGADEPLRIVISGANHYANHTTIMQKCIKHETVIK